MRRWYLVGGVILVIVVLVLVLRGCFFGGGPSQQAANPTTPAPTASTSGQTTPNPVTIQPNPPTQPQQPSSPTQLPGTTEQKPQQPSAPSPPPVTTPPATAQPPSENKAQSQPATPPSPLVRTLRGDQIDILSLAFSPDGQLLASGGEDSTIKQNLARLRWGFDEDSDRAYERCGLSVLLTRRTNLGFRKL